MTRSLSLSDLVQLPKLDASSALALGKELLTLATAQAPLPTSIQKAQKPFVKAHTKLKSTVAERLSMASASNDPSRRAADRDLDAAWSALFDFLSAWSKLPAPKQASKSAMAKELLEVLFPDGLKFIQLAYKVEWAESERRLERIRQEKFDLKLADLQGSVFLEALQTAHKTYGQVLGITKVIETLNVNESIHLNEDLADFLTAMRSYVLQVVAYADSESNSQAFLQTLLKPLIEWQAKPALRRSDEQPEPNEKPATS